MPLDVTVGGPTADAYVSITEADAFAASDLGRFAKAWLDAPVETKEAALRRATIEIDAYAGVPGGDAYYYGTQSLTFPRATDVDPLTGAPLVPRNVKRANYLQAAYLILAADQIDDAALRRSKGFSSYANPDGTGGTVASSASQGRLHPSAEALIGSIDAGFVTGTIIPT
jgi:hypothetical protein